MSVSMVTSQISLELFPTPIEKASGVRQLGYRWIALSGDSDWQPISIYPAWVAYSVPFNITWNPGSDLKGQVPTLGLTATPEDGALPCPGQPPLNAVDSNGAQYTTTQFRPKNGVYRFTATIIVGSHTFVGDPEMVVGENEGPEPDDA